MYVCVHVCVCVTQLCFVFMSRADCALNESCSSLLGKSERELEERRKREDRRRVKGMDESREGRED